MSKNKSNLLINCDMGEWDAPHLVPCDEEIMPFVDLCNIACGGHAGSKKIIAQTIDLAAEHNVKIGAHPGFEDRMNFGRKCIKLTQNELHYSLKKQLEEFLSVCSALCIIPYHIKAHGALYHLCNQDERAGKVLIDVIKALNPSLVLLVAPNSKLEEKARKEGLITWSESFIDRRYNEDYTLVSRSEPDAVILDMETAKMQFESLSRGEIVAKNGKTKMLLSDTTCIHGDNPLCVEILKAIRNHE